MSEGFPATLRIQFARGERPYQFFVSRLAATEQGRLRYKVLAKRRPDQSLDVLVVEEPLGGRPRGIARVDVPRDAPSGWLEHWVRQLERDVRTRFDAFDVSTVETLEEWRALARRMGWSRP